MQSAAVAHSSEQGWSPERYADEGSAFVVRSHSIEYLAPSYAGQSIVGVRETVRHKSWPPVATSARPDHSAHGLRPPRDLMQKTTTYRTVVRQPVSARDPQRLPTTS
ncbi:MAG: hypothetical protein ACKVHE_10045 [Planctomycetales bacterium]|jgi:hypothetical protein